MSDTKVDLEALGKQQLKNVSTGEVVEMASLWAAQPVVAVFFRRWGCVFCRLWARTVSEIAPQLRENGVRLVGVGVDEIGLQDFQKGNYFDGELFVDVEKKTYKFLSFKRFSWPSILASLLTSESRSAIAKGRAMKLGGDLRGDGLQNGGALVVGRGGSELLLEFRQERPAEVIENGRLLAALGIKSEGDGSPGGTKVLDAKCELNGAAGDAVPEKPTATAGAE